MTMENDTFTCKYCGKKISRYDYETHHGYCGKCREVLDWKKILGELKEYEK